MVNNRLKSVSCRLGKITIMNIPNMLIDFFLSMFKIVVPG